MEWTGVDPFEHALQGGLYGGYYSRELTLAQLSSDSNCCVLVSFGIHPRGVDHWLEFLRFLADEDECGQIGPRPVWDFDHLDVISLLSILGPRDRDMNIRGTAESREVRMHILGSPGAHEATELVVQHMMHHPIAAVHCLSGVHRAPTICHSAAGKARGRGVHCQVFHLGLLGRCVDNPLDTKRREDNVARRQLVYAKLASSMMTCFARKDNAYLTFPFLPTHTVVDPQTVRTRWTGQNHGRVACGSAVPRTTQQVPSADDQRCMLCGDGPISWRSGHTCLCGGCAHSPPWSRLCHYYFRTGHCWRACCRFVHVHRSSSLAACVNHSK